MALDPLIELSQQLTADCTVAQQLIAVLDAEKQALIARDADTILANAKEKQLLLQALDGANQRRITLLEQAHLVDEQASDPHQPALPETTQTKLNTVNALRTQFETHLQLCEQLNLDNGALIASNRINIQKLLSALFGNESQPSSYGAEGQLSTSISPPRDRGKA